MDGYCRVKIRNDSPFGRAINGGGVEMGLQLLLPLIFRID